MTANEFGAVRKALGLTKAQLSKVLGVSSALISLYECDKAPISIKFEKRLNAFMEKPEREREKIIRNALGKESGYKYPGVRATGRIARALMEQHSELFGDDMEKAFLLAHWSQYQRPPRYTPQSKVIAWYKAAGKTPLITKAQLRKMWAQYAKNRKIAKC